MKKQQVIRAWKDEEYLQSLSAKERALIPASPAGIVDLQDSDLQSISGGCSGICTYGGWPTCFCC